MPELPEVETIVRGLKKESLIGRKVIKTAVFWDRTIATPTVTQFKKQLTHCKIKSISRRAKYIVFGLSNESSILIHLRMTGRIDMTPLSKKREKHEHVILDFDDHRQLRFTDTRKFGRWYLLENTEEKFNVLGPEPLGKNFKENEFTQALRSKKRQLKPLLLDQSFVAGLGNIYVDEALFEARLHPERLSSSIKPQQSALLYHAIRNVLKRGIDNMGTSLGKAETNYYSVGKRRGRNQDELKVFRRTGEPCPTCGQKIVRLIVGQRSSHICKKCQK